MAFRRTATKVNLKIVKSESKVLAVQVREFCEALVVPSGTLAGQNYVIYPWQQEIIRGLYRRVRQRGGRMKVGQRAVRQAVISIPRKNGKTGLIAVLALAHLCGPLSETGGEVYSAAADRDQASIVFRMMKLIIERNEILRRRTIIRDYGKSIEDGPSGSIYRALSSDAGTKHGLSASFVVYDELAQAPNRDLWDVLTTSTGARAEPLCVAISTQAKNDNGIMSELYDYGEQVLSGAVEDPAFFAYLRSAPDDADPWSEDVWKACNPGLGVIRSIEEMRSAARQAKRIPAREAAFRNLYLNQRVAAEASFLPISDWMQCTKDFSPDDLREKSCFLGMDLAQVRDLCAVVAYFPEGGYVLSWVWAPAATVEAAGRVPYEAWVKEGYLSVTKGRSTNKREIVNALSTICQTYDVQGLAYDRWGMAELERLMDEEGVYVPNPVPFGQGYASMGPAVEALERTILEGRLQHQDNPLLTWTFSNLAVDEDPAGNRKFTKARATDRIDPMIALTMAVGLESKQAVADYDFTGAVINA